MSYASYYLNRSFYSTDKLEKLKWVSTIYLMIIIFYIFFYILVYCILGISTSFISFNN